MACSKLADGPHINSGYPATVRDVLESVNVEGISTDDARR